MQVLARWKSALIVPLLLAARCGDGASEPPAIQAPLDRAVAAGLPGVIALVETPESERILASSGLSNRQTGEPMNPGALFRIASNSKTFVAAAAAELHARGTLGLDDPMSRWLPDSVTTRIENGDSVTLRQLLHHTSGVYDYLANDAFWNAVDSDPAHRWTALEALAYAFDEPALFPPGEDWDYSNSNYLLAGLIIDAATGSHHSAAIRSLLLEPLDLKETFYEYRDPLVGNLAHGYADIDGDGRLDDTYSYDQGYGLADGGLISTASDLARFIGKIAGSGGPLSEAAQQELSSGFIPLGGGDAYGLGIARIATPLGTALGHGGNVMGYASEMFYFQDLRTVVVVFANGTDDALDGIFERLVSEILQAAGKSLGRRLEPGWRPRKRTLYRGSRAGELFPRSSENRSLPGLATPVFNGQWNMARRLLSNPPDTSRRFTP